MLILSLFFSVIIIQIGRDISEQGMSIYQSPRFWALIVTMMLISFVATIA